MAVFGSIKCQRWDYNRAVIKIPQKEKQVMENHLPITCFANCFISCFIYYGIPYSVLSATTGSFLAALREGIIPAISVKSTLIRINTPATTGGR